MQSILDPRKYTKVYPDTNIVINQALAVLAGRLAPQDLNATVANMLKQENDALINVALNLSPSLSVSQLIWQALNLAINNPDLPKFANIFAIPIVLVLGSKTKTKLKSQLNVDKINQFFIEKQIFANGNVGFVSGKLLDPNAIAAIKPSQLYYWVRNLQQVKLWLPIEMVANPIEIINEGVFLRFLVGVTLNDDNNKNIDSHAFKNSSLELMRIIVDELKTDGVTLFPIPFAPVALSDAFVEGGNHRKEIAIQVALSNIVREIRKEQLTPVAVIDTEGEAIKLTVTAEEESKLIETSLWHLGKTDDFDLALNKITSLLTDIQIKWHYAN